MNIHEINKRIDNGDLYFKCASDNSYVLRAKPKTDNYYVKLTGQPEFKSEQNSSLLTNAYLEIKFITKKEYKDF